MAVECFWLEPTARARVSLRRYAADSTCPRRGYHDAKVEVGVREDLVDEEGVVHSPLAATYAEDPRWPTLCACGYVFGEDDERQAFTERLYRRDDTGDETTLREAPPGAMWDAVWLPWKGPDGRCLVVKCPDGFDWVIDGVASNCTSREDKGHRCWLRTGTPPRITVGKNAPGQRTCGAGAGSIGTPGYHGFLRDGRFT